VGGRTRPVKVRKPRIMKANFIGPVAYGNRRAEKKSGALEKRFRAPIASQVSWAIGAPQFNGGKAIVVRHREYLQQITSVAAFTGAGRYIIQPGLTDNFPWLGQIAGSFEQYQCVVKYIYRNRCSTSTGATVYCAMQYDVHDPEFKTVEDICTYAGARSEVAWTDFAFDARLQKSAAYKKYLIRTDVLPTSTDASLYDMAMFTICGVGTSAGVYLGDLFVEYTFKFFNPKMNPALLGAYGMTGSTTVGSVATFVAGQLVGMNAAMRSYFPSDVQKPVIDETAKTVTFPSPGTYDIAYNIPNPTGTAVIAPVNAGLWSLIDSAKGVLSDRCNTVTGTNPPAAGFGFTAFAKLAVSVAGCALQMKSLAGAGTGTITSVLTIAVEAAPYLLDFLGSNPVPPLEPMQFKNLKKCYPNHDWSIFERQQQMEEFEAHHREYKRLQMAGILDRKIAIDDSPFKEVVESNPLNENSADESDSPVEIRSHSRDPKKKKSKKSDLKNREV